MQGHFVSGGPSGPAFLQSKKLGPSKMWLFIVIARQKYNKRVLSLALMSKLLYVKPAEYEYILVYVGQSQSIKISFV